MSRRQGLRRAHRVRIDQRGRLEIVDPGWESLPLLRAIDPSFEVRRSPLVGFSRPRFGLAARLRIPIERRALRGLGEDELWAAHAVAMERFGEPVALGRPPRHGAATLLDLKVELARRLLGPCRLCPRRCAADRSAGERGACGVGDDATVTEHFVHVGEEPPINPSLLLSLGGCALRCRHCQQADTVDGRVVEGELLDARLWDRLDRRGARSLSFAGGNPDESLPAILRFLASAPRRWRLPVVWNTHAWSEEGVIDLLDGVVDAWLPDWKHGSAACGRACSGVADYPEIASQAIARMDRQGVPVFVRILVLPGHVHCCHEPALRTMAGMGLRNASVSIRGQYAPDGWTTDGVGQLGRRPTEAEIREVERLARDLGLALLGTAP